jgi:phosphoribosylglycinamide formyltransferase 2
VEGESSQPSFGNLAAALAEPGTDLRLFGKPEVRGRRRMGVALARGADCDEAKAKALAVVARVQVSLK